MICGSYLAACNGMLIIKSVGNESQTSWHTIVIPCHADGILCIGATDERGIAADFSSREPQYRW
jgi:hypothetical protein